MARRGRPRKDGPRKPCGRLRQGPSAPIIPERVLEQRRILVGAEHVRDQRASYPLGVLLLRGMLDQAQHDAGLRFAGLYIAVFGRERVRSHLERVIYGLRGGLEREDPAWEKRQAELKDELDATTTTLLSLSTRRPYQVLVNLAVFERPMRFMDSSRRRGPEAWAADQRDLAALQEATHALVEFFRKRARDRHRPAVAA